MEKEIKIMPGASLDDVIFILTMYDISDIPVYCIFEGHILHSKNITTDSAYIKVYGLTKKEYEREKKEINKLDLEKKEIIKINEGNWNKNINKEKRKTIITTRLVISGLKFIAENRYMSQKELIENLRKLGCTFTLKDIQEQFPTPTLLFEGMKKGDISCGASVIVNAMSGGNNRTRCDECFLSTDNDISIYHFIRVVTGDETYTKENIDARNISDIKKRIKR